MFMTAIENNYKLLEEGINRALFRAGWHKVPDFHLVSLSYTKNISSRHHQQGSDYLFVSFFPTAKMFSSLTLLTLLSVAATVTAGPLVTQGTGIS